MTNRDENNYKFHNPREVSDICYKVLRKIGQYRWNEKKRREERINWYYESKEFTKNPALIFGRIIPEAEGKDKDENKERYLKLVINEIKNTVSNTGIIDFLNGRITRNKAVMEKEGFKVEEFSSTLLWRMIIGLGASHPQETSMTLHHIYGIPYIPGSAVKGVTRHWVIWKDFGGEEENALKNQDFINIFGTQSQQGKIIFFDAYPIDEIRLKIDVMTPHYPEYYSGEKAPTDWQSPIPIKFLTVEKTKFRFHLASKKENESLLQKASSWLKGALTYSGIGAKTAIGYGYFSFNYGG